MAMSVIQIVPLLLTALTDSSAFSLIPLYLKPSPAKQGEWYSKPAI